MAIMESHSGWRLNEDIEMSHPVSFGELLIITSSFCRYITAKKCQKTILQQNMAWGMVKFAHKTYFLRILKNVAHLFIQQRSPTNVQKCWHKRF
jgi:hypothetical protein